MKNLNKYSLLLLLFFLLTNCINNKSNHNTDPINSSDINIKKNNQNQKYINDEILNKKKIAEALLSPLNRIDFKNKILPAVKNLKEINSKYKILHIISDKLSKAINQNIFDIGLKNFKNEFNNLNK